MKLHQDRYGERENLPEWYWSSGLHDACIYGVETFELPFDYGRFEGARNNYERNLFLLRINAEGAIFDTTLREIRLYNYKILSTDVLLEKRKEVWWLSDRLTVCDGHYILELDLQDFDDSRVEFTFTIKFDRAEVVRD